MVVCRPRSLGQCDARPHPLIAPRPPGPPPRPPRRSALFPRAPPPPSSPAPTPSNAATTSRPGAQRFRPVFLFAPRSVTCSCHIGPSSEVRHCAFSALVGCWRQRWAGGRPGQGALCAAPPRLLRLAHRPPTLRPSPAAYLEMEILSLSGKLKFFLKMAPWPGARPAGLGRPVGPQRAVWKGWRYLAAV
jgi:hypothetical protein